MILLQSPTSIHHRIEVSVEGAVVEVPVWEPSRVETHVVWLAFVFIGLWVGRLDATRFVVQISLLLGGIIAMVIAWLLMWWLQPSASFFDGVAGYFNEAFWSLSSIPPGPLYILSATGSALVVIGLCLLVVPWLGWVFVVAIPLVAPMASVVAVTAAVADALICLLLL